MKRLLSFLMAAALVALPAEAKGNKEEERLESAGKVLEEILDIPVYRCEVYRPPGKQMNRGRNVLVGLEGLEPPA